MRAGADDFLCGSTSASAFCFAMRLTLCARCGALTANRPSICDGCLAGRKESKRELNSAYDRLRDPRSVKFYHSKAWKDLRVAYLASVGYLCEDCTAEVRAGMRRPEEISVATDVHHRVPLAQAWTLRLTWSNLQALCDFHHKGKRKQSPGGGRKSIGPGGATPRGIDGGGKSPP